MEPLSRNNGADVTVVTAAFNAEAVIARAVASVANQTFGVKEHIVVDDGSHDGTADVVRSLQRDYPHVVLVQQPNGGAGVARNAGIRVARGRYIAFLDADDQWDSGKLAAQIGFMQETGASISHGDYRVVDAASATVLRTTSLPREVDHSALLRGCPVGCLTVAFDTSVHGRAEMPTIRRGQDWAFWLRLTRNGATIRKYPGTLASYQTGGASLSKNKLKKIADVYSIYREQERLSHLASMRFVLEFAMTSAIKNRGKSQGEDSSR